MNRMGTIQDPYGNHTRGIWEKYGICIPYAPHCDCQIIAGFACFLFRLKKVCASLVSEVFSALRSLCFVFSRKHSPLVCVGKLLRLDCREVLLSHALPGDLIRKM